MVSELNPAESEPACSAALRASEKGPGFPARPCGEAAQGTTFYSGSGPSERRGSAAWRGESQGNAACLSVCLLRLPSARCEERGVKPLDGLSQRSRQLFAYSCRLALPLSGVPRLSVGALRSGRFRSSARATHPDGHGCRASVRGCLATAGLPPALRKQPLAARRQAAAVSQALLGRGSPAADAVFSAKHDHLRVCAGVSIFVSRH